MLEGKEYDAVSVVCDAFGFGEKSRCQGGIFY